MAKSQKKAFTMDAKVTVKAVDQKTAIQLLEVMLERRGFDAVINEKTIAESEVKKPAKEKKEDKKEPAKKQKKEVNAKASISNGIGPNALE